MEIIASSKSVNSTPSCPVAIVRVTNTTENTSEATTGRRVHARETRRCEIGTAATVSGGLSAPTTASRTLDRTRARLPASRRRCEDSHLVRNARFNGGSTVPVERADDDARHPPACRSIVGRGHEDGTRRVADHVVRHRAEQRALEPTPTPRPHHQHTGGELSGERAERRTRRAIHDADLRAVEREPADGVFGDLPTDRLTFAVELVQLLG